MFLLAFRFSQIFLMLCLASVTSFQVKDIIRRILEEKEFSTIAFFGRNFALESVLSEADANIPRMVFTESFGDLYFSGNFNKNILVIACVNLWQKPWLNRIDVAIRGTHLASRSVYVIRGDRHKNLRYLFAHFEWCWARGFVNVLVVFTPTSEIYSYTRFPDMKILRISDEEIIFQDRFRNMMGYPIRTPLMFDPPRVFHYVNSLGRIRLTGYCADLFLNFLGRHNATMEIVHVRNSTDYDIPSIVKLIHEGMVDISIHTYMNFENTRSSYPIRMMQWCILVPYRGEIRSYWYFIRPFQFVVWFGCLGMLICLSAYVTMEYYVRDLRFDFGRSLCEVFCFMLCLPVTDRRPIIPRCAFHRMLIFMLGFMLTNLYLAYLTSFLAKIIFEPQIETLAELVETNISILTRSFEIPLILRNKGLPVGFDRLLIPAPAADLLHYRWSLKNQSFAYTTTDDKAMFVLFQQMHLQRPLYKVVDQCVSTVPIGFLMAKHSPFEVILNRFILRINSAGLLNKWWDDIYLNGMKAGILHVIRSNEEAGPPLTMGHFQFLWIALSSGLGIATICLLFEKLAKVLSGFRVTIVRR